MVLAKAVVILHPSLVEAQAETPALFFLGERVAFSECCSALHQGSRRRYPEW